VRQLRLLAGQISGRQGEPAGITARVVVEEIVPFVGSHNAGVVVDAAAITVGGGIPREGAVGYRQRAGVVDATAVVSRISGERAIDYGQRALVLDAAADQTRSIGNRESVDECGDVRADGSRADIEDLIFARAGDRQVAGCRADEIDLFELSGDGGQGACQRERAARGKADIAEAGCIRLRDGVAYRAGTGIGGGVND
jgi:hypothetical protein